MDLLQINSKYTSVKKINKSENQVLAKLDNIAIASCFNIDTNSNKKRYAL